MRRILIFLGCVCLPSLGLLFGLKVANVAYARSYDSLIDWIAEYKANDSRKAWAVVIRDVGRLADDYTTITATQKFKGLLKFSEAVCSGTRPNDIATYLTEGEQRNAKIVWAALKAEWQAADSADDAAQANTFDGEF